MRRCPDPGQRPKHPQGRDLDGFWLHCGVAFGSGQTDRLERLCRYLTRPPLATERLSLTGDGRVRYTFRRPWRDGTTAILFEPFTLIERLAALVPRPGVHLLTYHGILAPAASYRDRVVPVPVPDEDAVDGDAGPIPCRRQRCRTTPDGRELPGRLPRRPRTLWADLLRRVFGLNILRCPCGGRRHLLTFLTDPAVIDKILRHLGLDRDAQEMARPPPGR